MSFEQDEYQAHHRHPIEVATYGRPGEPVNVAIECTRCYQVLFDLDAETADAADFAALLAHAGHKVSVVEEGAALACRTDHETLRVAEQR